MENKPSDLEVRYLKVKLKILRSSMSEGGLKTGGINSNGESTSTHSRNSSSETDSLSSDEGDQGPTDRIRVLLQLLKYLRCGRDISLAEALPLVQRLIKTVEQLKMLDEAAQLSEWTLDISFGLLESGTGTYAQVSESFTHFAVRLTAAGHYGAAIAVAKDHVANCRKVSELEPTKWLPELALALRNQAAALHKLGRHNEEIKAIVESINAHERHAGYEEPTHFRSADYPLLHPHLNTALALNNLSRKLHSCSRYDDAVSASSASVEIFRRLSHTPSAENLSGLAVSYDILSSPLIGLERYEDAIKAMSESTDVYRKLAKEQPATYSADFARISGKLSTQLTNMGRYEETFKLLEDTISIHRQSIESDIPGLRNNLAASLIAASSTLCLLERYEEALTAATECVSNYRRLQNGSSTVFIVELAFGLERLAWSLHKLGHNSAAIPNLDEALQLLSSNKVDIKSDRYTLARGACLKTMTACLSHLGQHRRAIETGTEAAEIAYTLWTKNPHLYAYEMADYQLHKSRALHRSGELQMARTSAEMSVRMYKKLAKGFPLRYTEAADAAKEHLAELMMALEERENAEKLLDGSDCQSLDRTRS
ncbi:hypothetical protein FRC03_002566 [Tulasnella sp. 419]|nr:hypothetical protein FRC03_002566 [Tulasnella sp. 419]